MKPEQRTLKRILLLLALLPSLGCLDRLRVVRAYQENTTRKCLEHHTPEQCQPNPLSNCASYGAFMQCR